MLMCEPSVFEKVLYACSKRTASPARRVKYGVVARGLPHDAGAARRSVSSDTRTIVGRSAARSAPTPSDRPQRGTPPVCRSVVHGARAEAERHRASARSSSSETSASRHARASGDAGVDHALGRACARPPRPPPTPGTRLAPGATARIASSSAIEAQHRTRRNRDQPGGAIGALERRHAAQLDAPDLVRAQLARQRQHAVRRRRDEDAPDALPSHRAPRTA